MNSPAIHGTRQTTGRSLSHTVLFYISGHGLGHLAQTAPVINAFARQYPDIAITVVTAISRQKLAERLTDVIEFDHVQQSTDPGLVMQSALAVDNEATARAYQRFETDLPTLIETEVERIHSTRAIGIFSNVSWLPLLAAAKAKKPAVAMSTLNWADMLALYGENEPELASLIASGYSAYNSAALFIQPSPSIPMTRLNNVVTVNPVLQPVPRDPATLRSQLHTQSKHIGLISTGGIDMTMDLRDWPAVDPKLWLWLVSDDAITSGTAFQQQVHTGQTFPELLHSANIVICKPGYGTFTEAVAAKTPILYLSRGDWPEEPHLVNWAQRQGHCERITLESVLDGSVTDTVTRVIERAANQTNTQSATFGGETQVLELIAPLFSLS